MFVFARLGGSGALSGTVKFYGHPCTFLSYDAVVMVAATVVHDGRSGLLGRQRDLCNGWGFLLLRRGRVATMVVVYAWKEGVGKVALHGACLRRSISTWNVICRLESCNGLVSKGCRGKKMSNDQLCFVVHSPLPLMRLPLGTRPECCLR